MTTDLLAQLTEILEHTCRTCKGKGYIDGPHKPGFTHYETDAGESCPGYHYELIPCRCVNLKPLAKFALTVAQIEARYEIWPKELSLALAELVEGLTPKP